MRRRRFRSRKTIAALEALGYDVRKGDVVYGRREDDAVYQVWLDKGGMMRLTVSRFARAPEAERRSKDGREYAILREEHALVTVRARLASPDEIQDVLRTAERLAEEAAASPPDLQESTHHKESEHGIDQG